MSDDQAKDNPATIFGGVDMTARFVGRPECPVKIRQLAVKDYAQAAKALDNGGEIELLAVVSGLPLVDVERLTPESHWELADAMIGSNPFFLGYFARRAAFLGMGKASSDTAAPKASPR